MAILSILFYLLIILRSRLFAKFATNERLTRFAEEHFEQATPLMSTLPSENKMVDSIVQTDPLPQSLPFQRSKTSLRNIYSAGKVPIGIFL